MYIMALWVLIKMQAPWWIWVLYGIEVLIALDSRPPKAYYFDRR